MFTNTYVPHVGGVARSVETAVNGLRGAGHEVFVIAPEFDEMPALRQTLRVPALTNLRGSGFSAALPLWLLTPLKLLSGLVAPDVIHSHHPYLLGDDALDIARRLKVPLVYTYHTMYEHYAQHFTKGPMVKDIAEAAVMKAAHYCSMCSHVVSPSSGIMDLLLSRGVRTPMTVQPTGVDIDMFGSADRSKARDDLKVGDRFVIGHVGRLSHEKNLEFVSGSVRAYMKKNEKALFLLVGDGPSRPGVMDSFKKDGMSSRVCYLGVRKGRELAQAYAAMDVFAFASTTETQGMVLVESMAAGTPVVACSATGVDDVVENGSNGYRVSPMEFVGALDMVYRSNGSMRGVTKITAMRYSISSYIAGLLHVYTVARRRHGR